jgi:hypothetical protein
MQRERLFNLDPPRISAKSFLKSYREKWLVPESFEDCHKDILHIQEEQFPSSPDFSVQKWLHNIDYERHRKLATHGEMYAAKSGQCLFQPYLLLIPADDYIHPFGEVLRWPGTEGL